MSNKHTSTKQFATLVEFLKENSGIKKGILNAPEYKAKNKELWDEITVVLNSLGPPVKTLDGWKKVWKDFKYNIKDKLRENKKSMKVDRTNSMCSRSKKKTLLLCWT
ncbi:uncharacterized protein LOC129948289 [Eupeodes corollae]|uniref:uncharacterized protein LOC129948289 n=1 Tax=Eupeodes corollae TaxID=290404 RepID=UPI002490F671|nr:uncharacterized protein LOC129948289 [Eupeodes corollae]